MVRLKKGPKTTASGWPHVYNLPSRHGQTRWYFWFGRKGQRQFRVQDDIISGKEFQAAYARFLAGQHPYPDQAIIEKAKAEVAARNPKPTRSLTTFPVGSWGWLCLECMTTTTFTALKNGRASEGQLR